MKFLTAILFINFGWATTATISVPARVRAGASIILAGSGTGTGALTYSWTQLSGPSTGDWIARTTTTPTFITLLAGSYTIQLKVTDSNGVVALASTILGVTATDNNCVIITGNPGMDKLLDPLLGHGCSPWPYFDIMDRAVVDTIFTAAIADPPHLGTASSGTSAMTCSGIDYCSVFGTGTSYLIDFADNDEVFVTWNSVDGVDTGRLYTTIRSRIDATHMILNSYIVQISLPTAGHIYHVATSTATYQNAFWCIPCGNPSNNYNYYDTALAAYRLYWRTGIVTYLTYARQMADYWWEYVLDHGRASGPPRGFSLQSQFIRALDGKPERFPDLYTLIEYFRTGYYGVLPTSLTNIGNHFDPREVGYITWYMALGAMSDPNAGRHTNYCNNLTLNVLPSWIAWQRPEGYWSEDLFNVSNFPLLPPGTSPWRTDIPIHGLQAAYDALIDTSSLGCNQPVLATTLLTTITNAVAFTYNQGRSTANGGVYYNVGFESDGLVANYGAGTVSVSLGSPNVVGIGTAFLTNFGSTGTKYIGFLTARRVYRVLSSSDNTHMIISPAFGSQGEVADSSGETYTYQNKSSTGCASTAIYCNDLGIFPPFPPNGDRNLTRLMSGIFGWQYSRTGITARKTEGDLWFSNAFGGPAAGPGQPGLCGGPNCDGVEIDTSNSLPGCFGLPAGTYCYGGGSGVHVYDNTGKNYGQASGSPGAQTYLARRLGDPLPSDPRLVKFSGKISSCTSCVKMKVTITALSNVVESTTTCSSSPCDVMVEAKAGYSVFQIDYLNSSNAVISVGTKLRLNF